jgi:hypothetical protein
MVWLHRSPIPVGRRGVFLPAVTALRGGGGVITLWEDPDISPANLDFKKSQLLIVAFKCGAALKKCEVAVSFPPGSGNRPHTELCDTAS